MSPRSHLHRRSFLAAAAGLGAAALTGCSTGDSTGAGHADGGAPSAAAIPATRVVASQFGKVELPTDPQAALGFYTTDVDILIALGIPLARMQPIRGDAGTDWPSFFPQDALAGIDTFANYPDYNYEKVAAAAPDLILNGLGYDKATVKKLPRIAPTYSVDAFDGSDWRTTFARTARALGRVQQQQAWEREYRERLADANAKLDAAGERPVVIDLGYWNDQVQVGGGGTNGVPALVFADLGLPVLPLARKAGNDGVALSLEQLDRLAGVHVAYSQQFEGPQAAAEHDQLAAKLARAPGWSDLPFVRDDRWYTYNGEMYYGSPSGHLAFLDRVVATLT